MKALGALLLFAGATSFCTGEAFAADPAMLAKARAMLESTAIDYPSVRLEGFRVVRSTMDKSGRLLTGIPVGTPVVAVCGRMNGKNRMGGYTGWDDIAIIVEGRAYDTVVSKRDEYGSFASLCPRVQVPTGNILLPSPGAVIEPEDVTSALVPGAGAGTSFPSSGPWGA